MFQRDMAGVLLASGYPNKTREVKYLMKLGRSNVIERATESMILGGIYNLLLVTGENHNLLLRDYLYQNDVRVVGHEGEEDDLTSAVRAGVDALPRNIEAFALMPADCAAVNPETMIEMIRFFKEEVPNADVLVPVLAGKDGFPVLFSAKLIPEILSETNRFPFGIESMIEHFSSRCYRMPVTDDGVVRTIDTMSDFYLMEWQSEDYDLSNPMVGHRLLNRENIPEHIKEHCRFVAEITNVIANELYLRKVDIDRDAAGCAALLHDIKRLEPDHVLAGKRFAFDHGLPRAGSIIGSHMGRGIDDRVLGEKEVVFLADKYAFEDILVSLDRRFDRAEHKYRQDGPRLASVKQAHMMAKTIRGNIDRLIKEPLDIVLKKRLG